MALGGDLPYELSARCSQQTPVHGPERHRSRTLGAEGRLLGEHVVDTAGGFNYEPAGAWHSECGPEGYRRARPATFHGAQEHGAAPTNATACSWYVLRRPSSAW